MSIVKLDIKGISYSQTQSGAYALVLSEVEGERTLPIIIGAFEAQSIAIALEKEIKPPRPLTHDLFRDFADCFDINIIQVTIYKLVDGVFFSSLICEREGLEQTIDARTSDAIALATRFNAPIYTYESILDQAGIYLKIGTEDIITATEVPEEEAVVDRTTKSDVPNELSDFSLKELHQKLNKAVAQENYEMAAKIRDEISNRS
jgi:bifunctional DNase/RNase